MVWKVSGVSFPNRRPFSNSTMAQTYERDLQYYKFCLYGFFKNLRFFEPFLILFFLEKGLTYLQIGTLYAVREIVTNILEIPTGVVADAVGRRSTMISSFVAYVLSFVVFTITDSYTFLIGAMILFSFGEAFRTGTHKAMIFEHLTLHGWQDQKVHYYGHTRSWSQIGSAVSALIAAGIVFSSGSFRVVFLYSTIPYVLDLILMVTYPRTLEGNRNREKHRSLGQSVVKTAREFIFAFRNAVMLRAVANLSLFSGFYKAAKDYLQPVLQTLALSLPILLALESRQRSSMVIGVVYFCIFLLTSFSSRFSGRIAERLKSLCLVLNASLVVGYAMGILSGLFLLLAMPIVSVVLYLVLYMVHNLRRPAGIAYFADMLNTDILATALSAESQASSLAAAILAPIMGFLADLYGIGASLLIASGVLLLTTPLYAVRSPKGSTPSRQ